MWIDASGERDFAIVDPYITVFYGPSKNIDDNIRIRSNRPDDDYEIVVDKKDFEVKNYLSGIEKLDLSTSDIQQGRLIVTDAEELAYFSEQLEGKNKKLKIDVIKVEILFDQEKRPEELKLFYNYIKDGEETKDMVRKYHIDYLSERAFNQEYFVQKMPDFLYFIFGNFFRMGMIQGAISIALFILGIVFVIWLVIRLVRRKSV